MGLRGEFGKQSTGSQPYLPARGQMNWVELGGQDRWHGVPIKEGAQACKRSSSQTQKGFSGNQEPHSRECKHRNVHTARACCVYNVHQLYIVQERTNEQLYKICTAILANVALPDMCLLVLSILLRELKANTSPLHIQNFAGFSASCKPILVSNLTTRWKTLTNTQINITF